MAAYHIGILRMSAASAVVVNMALSTARSFLSKIICTGANFTRSEVIKIH